MKMVKKEQEDIRPRNKCMSGLKKESDAGCPICGVVEVRVLDLENDVYSCVNGHFWKATEGVYLPLRLLAVSEVSVKLSMLSNQYREALNQLQKMGAWDGVDFDCLDDFRSAQIEMVEDGELMVFIRPNNSILYVLTCMIP